MARLLTRTRFAVTRHGLLNLRIAALLRSMVTLDHHPPKGPQHARRGGDRASEPGAKHNIGSRHHRRSLPITPAQLTCPAPAIR
jgi:hypothetical protein